MTNDKKQAIWLRINVGATDQCWEWTGPKTPKGYGRFSIGVDGKTHHFYSHRLAYEQKVGPLVSGMEIRHLCGNSSCCNPAHLTQGTHAENMKDMVTHGTKPLGYMFSHTKFAGNEVEKIIEAHNNGESQTSIAKRLGCHQSTINRIVHGTVRGRYRKPIQDKRFVVSAMVGERDPEKEVSGHHTKVRGQPDKKPARGVVT